MDRWLSEREKSVKSASCDKENVLVLFCFFFFLNKREVSNNLKKRNNRSVLLEGKEVCVCVGGMNSEKMREGHARRQFFSTMLQCVNYGRGKLALFIVNDVNERIIKF